jgi:hypothetical protein
MEAVTTMIIVQRVDEVKGGELFPRYVTDSHVLAVESKESRPWRYSIDVNGALVFDLDEQRVLASFELMARKEAWKRAGLIPKPKIDVSGCLQFATETVETRSFPLLGVSAESDSAQESVYIRLGDDDSYDAAIALSQDCTALLSGSVLRGFVISNIRCSTE